MDERTVDSSADRARIPVLVHEFATRVLAQDDATRIGHTRKGNEHASACVAAFKALCEYGDAGRDALAWLFAHSSADVRVSAAAFLLRHRHAEARAVLEEESGGPGLAGFCAEQCLKRWEEGAWHLDPE